jgi:anti-anti-sigma factor
MTTLLQIFVEEPRTLRLVGDFDQGNEARLRAALSKISGPLELDMADVTFMDSSIVQLIAARLKMTPVTIVAASRAVRKVLELSGLKALIDEDLGPGRPPSGRSGPSPTSARGFA